MTLLKVEDYRETDGLTEELDRQAEIYERHLHARNFMRMQELLDESSFKRWNDRRMAGRSIQEDSHHALNNPQGHERPETGGSDFK